MLQLGDTLSKGNLNQKEVEAVALVVSQANECNYCLAAHTAIGKMIGFSEEETVDIRLGSATGSKLSALTKLALEITESRGVPAQSTVDAFFEAGYSKGALVDVIGLVALNTYTNYLNRLADTKIDFPKAPHLETVTTR